MEKSQTITFKGNPLTLLGERKKVGDVAPDVTLVNQELKPVSLLSSVNSIKLIASVPSIDTPVCDLEVKRFNKEAVGLRENITIVTVSMDLPFAQKRFCVAHDIEQVITLSDHKDAAFGMQYGVLIKEFRLLARALFIVDTENRIQYVEYVPELSDQPQYDRVLEVLGKI